MKVKWLGHAAMLLTSSKGLKVITDPYAPGAFGLGYSPIDESADIVTISHDHADHNDASSVKGNPSIVKGGGNQTVQEVEFRGIDTFHDSSSGTQRGANTVFCFTLDEINVCHLGDLGHALTRKNEAQIGPVDILFIPVGGNFTIDAKDAAAVCQRLNPRVVIPIHFRNERSLEFPVSGVEDFLKLMKNVKRENESEVEFYKDALPKDTQVVLLKPSL